MTAGIPGNSIPTVLLHSYLLILHMSGKGESNRKVTIKVYTL